jgi:hypothetical protein
MDVICDVPIYFCLPELMSGRRPFKEMTIMVMPEASVDKNNRPVSWKHEIRFAGQIADMQSIPQTGGMHGLSDMNLRLRMAAFDGGHVPAARCRVVNVWQFRRLSGSGLF